MKLIRQWFLISILIYAAILFFPARWLVASGADVWQVVIVSAAGGIICGLVCVFMLAAFAGREDDD